MDFFRKDPNQIKVCELCKKDFNITRIRHKCKRCSRTICADCGKGRFKIITFDFANPHKACTLCDAEHTFQQDLIIKEELSWAHQSAIGMRWLEKCQAQEGMANASNKSFADYLMLAQDSQNIEYDDFKVIDKDVTRGRTNRQTMNYSLQDFLYCNQLNYDPQYINTMISNVLQAFCMKYPAIGYTQGMNFIACHILCFMNQESAFWVLSNVIANILPLNFYGSIKQGIPLMGYQQEKFIISELARQILQIDEINYSKVQIFMDINGPALLIPLLINYVSFQILYETWNEMIMTQSFSIMRKVLIKVIEIMLPLIEKEVLINPPVAQAHITKNFTIDEFHAAKNLVIDEKTLRELEESFKSEYSSQWMSTETSIYRQLQGATHFSKNEIIELQKEFNKYIEPDSEEKDEETQKMKSTITGIKKKAFLKVIDEVIAKDEDKKIYIQSFDLGQIFDLFDVDKNGLLDFKEFLFSISMLMRGSLEERVQFAFQIYDKGDKGHLTVEEYEEFLKSIIQVLMLSNTGMIGVFFNEDLDEFEKAMLAYAENKEMITFLELKKELLGHDFIQSCDETEVTRKRGETITRIATSFSLMSKGSNRSSIQPQIPMAIEETNEDEEDKDQEEESPSSSKSPIVESTIREEEDEKSQNLGDSAKLDGSQNFSPTTSHLKNSTQSEKSVKNLNVEVSGTTTTSQSEEFKAESPSEEKKSTPVTSSQIRYRETEQDFEEGIEEDQSRNIYGRIETWDPSAAANGIRKVNLEKSQANGKPNQNGKGESCQMCNIF